MPGDETRRDVVADPEPGMDSGQATVRNVRSKCRCSCVLQFTFRRAVSCVLHRPPSQVIHCTVLYFPCVIPNSQSLKWKEKHLLHISTRGVGRRGGAFTSSPPELRETRSRGETSLHSWSSPLAVVSRGALYLARGRRPPGETSTVSPVSSRRFEPQQTGCGTRTSSSLSLSRRERTSRGWF